MKRTPEQIAADENLEKALLRSLEAWGLRKEGMMLGDHMVLVTQLEWNAEDEDDRTAFCVLLSNGTMPWHRMIGLVEMAKISVQQDFLSSED